MKTIIKLLLCSIILQIGCRGEAEDSINDSRPRGPYLVNICFVDEAGNNLLDRLKLDESNGFYYLNKSQYVLDRWLNGKALGSDSESIRAVPSLGGIVIPFTIEANLLENNNREVWVYAVEFVCPDLLGDDLVHTFVIEKKAQNRGLMNNFERLLFDGKLIATDMEGDGTDNDRLPIVIVVPQK